MVIRRITDTKIMHFYIKMNISLP